MTPRFLPVFLAALGLHGAALAAGPVRFTVETSRLRVTDEQALVEYYVTVDGTTVRYEPTPQGFVARVGVTLTAADSASGEARYARKLVLRSPALPDTLHARPAFRLHERLALPAGAYRLRWDAVDQVRGAGAPEVGLEVPLRVGYPASRGVQVADVQLLESFQRAAVPDAFTKGGFALEGRVSDFYPPEAEALRFYTEIYHATSQVKAGEPLSIRYRLLLLGGPRPVRLGERTVKQAAADVNPVLAELNIGAVPSGNCELLVEALGADGKVLATGRRSFQRLNPGLSLPTASADISGDLKAQAAAAKDVDLQGTFVADLDSTKLAHYLLSLRPVATVVEVGFLQTLAREGTVRQQRVYLLHFWEKQAGGNRADATQRWNEYKRRIEYVDRTFANPTFRAYETDQGRVYLQYGPPDQLFTERTDPKRTTANSDGRPYQIWNYYKLKNVATNSNQTNKTFVFFSRNLGDPSARLIHSNALGETSNPDWRAQVGDKFSGRSAFDRNAQ